MLNTFTDVVSKQDYPQVLVHRYMLSHYKMLDEVKKVFTCTVVINLMTVSQQKEHTTHTLGVWIHSGFAALAASQFVCYSYWPQVRARSQN